MRTNYPVLVQVSSELIDYLPQLTGQPRAEILSEVEPPDDKGWVRMTLRFENLETARARLLALGGAIEIVEPLALRRSVLDFAHQTVQRHQAEGTAVRSIQKRKDP
jgi:predicted DNA-binding transcriptional regulator YafY